jgi:DtxR family Mn-dependent transcriptional regulator
LHSVADDYLEALYTLQAEGADAFAVTLAELFAVSRANASATLGRLLRDGLILQNGRHFVLTTAGRARAEAGIRRHRVVERFLLDVLGMPWEDVHGEARSFARDMTSFLEARIDDHLALPRFCPHGNPIPRPDLDATTFLRAHGALRLSQATGALPLRILALSELAPPATSYFPTLARHGLLPGASLTITTLAHAQDAMRISVSGVTIPITADLASHIWTLPLTGEQIR